MAMVAFLVVLHHPVGSVLLYVLMLMKEAAQTARSEPAENIHRDTCLALGQTHRQTGRGSSEL